MRDVWPEFRHQPKLLAHSHFPADYATTGVDICPSLRQYFRRNVHAPIQVQTQKIYHRKIRNPNLDGFAKTEKQDNMLK
jgi:hypothetical protein